MGNFRKIPELFNDHEPHERNSNGVFKKVGGRMGIFSLKGKLKQKEKFGGGKHNKSVILLLGKRRRKEVSPGHQAKRAKVGAKTSAKGVS